jgi:polyisoprenoid-binding protein YceI
MKRILSGILLFLLVAAFGAAQAEEKVTVVPAPALPEPRTLALDLKESRVRWVGKKVTGQHNGTIQVKSGEIHTKGDALTGGKFEIDMTTIAVEDLTNSKQNAKLTNHLKSNDFFAVSQYPTAVFQITEVKPGPEGRFDVTGNLTVKGITNPVSFPVKVETAGGKAKATGTFTLDRTKWDVRYGSGKFFKGLGDKLIHDDFEISFDVAAAIPANR